MVKNGPLHNLMEVIETPLQRLPANISSICFFLLSAKTF